MTSYDHLGITYNQTRQAEARIITALFKALDLPHSSILADIGAGICACMARLVPPRGKKSAEQSSATILTLPNVNRRIDRDQNYWPLSVLSNSVMFQSIGYACK
jgi:hypothetical protein